MAILCDILYIAETTTERADKNIYALIVPPKLTTEQLFFS